MNDRLDRI